MTPYYQDDRVTLYLGDCREITDWLSADVLVTDPPYGVAWAQNSMHYTRTVEPTRNVIRGDEDSSARDHVLNAWGARPAIVFGNWRIPRPLGARHRLIWHKTRRYPGMTTAPWYPADEEIYVVGDGFRGKPEQNVYPTHEERTGPGGLAAKIGHPTPKPLPLMEALIAKCPSGTITDPFAGSGSTLVAARSLGRHAIGVELEERYCEIAARRLAQDCLDFGEIA